MSEKLSDRLRRAQEALPALLDESVLMVTAQRLSQDLNDAAQLATLVEEYQRVHRIVTMDITSPDYDDDEWDTAADELDRINAAFLAFDLGVSQE